MSGELKTEGGREPPPQILEDRPIDLYRRAVDMRTITATVLPRERHPLLHDQLERASLLVVLSLCEACKPWEPFDQRRYLKLARSNVTKATAALDLMRPRALADGRDIGRARHHLEWIAARIDRLLDARAPALAGAASSAGAASIRTGPAAGSTAGSEVDH